MQSVFGLENINTVKCTRVIIDFLRYVFGKLTPVQYRWESEMSRTKVVIGGHEIFGLDNPGGIIRVVVVRSSYQIEHKTINQQRPSLATYGPKSYSDLMDGNLSVVVEAGTSEECTGLATFCGMIINANRHIIMKEAGTFHALKLRGIAEERTVDMQAKPIRIQCAAIFEAPLNMAWIEDKKNSFSFNSLSMQHMDQPIFTSHCNYSENSKILIDSNARFGYFNTNSPQFVEQDLLAKWYAVRFKASGKERKIISVVAPDKLELVDTIDETAGTNIEYDIIYNSMYFEILAQKS